MNHIGNMLHTSIFHNTFCNIQTNYSAIIRLAINKTRKHQQMSFYSFLLRIISLSDDVFESLLCPNHLEMQLFYV